jgi:hypothetical protein
MRGLEFNPHMPLSFFGLNLSFIIALPRVAVTKGHIRYSVRFCQINLSTNIADHLSTAGKN